MSGSPAFIAFGLLIALFLASVVVVEMRVRRSEQKIPKRGFEVKPTTGETPVPREEHKAD